MVNLFHYATSEFSQDALKRKNYNARVMQVKRALSEVIVEWSQR